MPFSSRKFLLALLLATPLLRSFAQQPHRIDDAALKNAGKSGDEWLTYGIDQGETRYSPLNQINTTNVSRLGPAWSYDLGVGGGNQEATPLVWNGTIYSITNWSVVFAVDARTGKERWRWDPEVNQAAVRSKICCGVVNRGVAIYQGKIIAPIIDGRLEALDAETGKPVWEARVAYPQDNYTLTMAPRIAKGKVIIGVAGAEFLVRGFFAAYDADTGKFAWRFYTVPGDPSKPFENPALKKAAETWSGEWWKLGGGGSVWDGMAYDPDADLFYVGTGNGGPWPEQLRQSKGKDNLYVASILAVKPETGELKWYFQTVPGDSWDFDSVQQLLLADITVKGKPRKVLMQANKDGFYYVLDRVTGQFISGQPFAQVTWAKGLDEVDRTPDRQSRSALRQREHHDCARDRRRAQLGADVVQSDDRPGLHSDLHQQHFELRDRPELHGQARQIEHRPCRWRRGRRRAQTTASQADAVKRLPPPPAIGPAPANGERRALVAWDPATQKERWRAPERRQHRRRHRHHRGQPGIPGRLPTDG